MLKIGAYLRTQRERKGLSHEQIYEATRISPDILRKIEEGRPLLAPIFLKGFIKNYAKALGLDPTPLLKDLEERETASQNRREPESEESSENPPSSPPWNRKKSISVSLGVGGLLAIYLAVLTVFPRFSKMEEGLPEETNQTEFQDAKQPPLTPQTEFQNTNPAPQMKLQDTEQTTLNPQTKFQDRNQTTLNPQTETEEPEISPLPPPPATSLIDTIHQGRFTQEVMINPSSQPLEVYFKADGGEMAAKSLPPKQWYVIKALEKIYLRIDQAASFSMVHNGEWRESVSPMEQTFE